ncbi:MAG: FAD-dependent oxidoreductase [Oscillospiraceae bacterium]|nr:FAD-dependent oxidoreductase [Oscillospiraceae bacterium]
MSGSECYEGGYDIEEGIAIAKQLEGHVDLIHVSAGSHEVKEVFTVTHPAMFLGEGPNVRFAAEIKKHVKTPVATVGALGDPEMMEDIIASGKADVIEIARSLIADPDLPTKIRTGREDLIRPCMRCLSCFTNEIMVGEKYCAVNPESGYEIEHKHELPKAEVKKRVLVVGGGIGGMEAAITCANRGHEVILCEKTDELGGKILCERDVPFKRNLDRYIKYQRRRIANSSIDLRMNTAVTPEYADEVDADVIIASLGTHPLVPRIPGIDGKGVLVSEYAYTHVDEIGKKVVILGAGLVGLELAAYLGALGREVTVVEMMPQINDGGNFLHAEGLMIELDKRKVQVNLNTKAVEIGPEGVKCEGPEGECFFPADTVIHALGQVPLREEALALQFCAPEFYMIGDCVAPRTITAATNTAFEIANSIGRF